MAFKINNNNIASLQSVNNIKKNNDLMAKFMERMSSGRRINDASDDAAGMAASMRLRSEIGSLGVAVRNSMEAGSALQIADGGMEQIGNMMLRVQELATQASSATSTQNIEVINNEISGLMEEIDRVASTTTYNGQALLDGSYDQTFQIGDKNAPDSKMQISIEDVATEALVNGTELSAEIVTQADAQSLLSDIGKAMDYLAAARAEVGVYTNRVQYQQSNLQVSVENKIAAESTIADADMAHDITEFTKAQIMLQADTAVLAQANMLSSIPLGIIK